MSTFEPWPWQTRVKCGRRCHRSVDRRISRHQQTSIASNHHQPMAPDRADDRQTQNTFLVDVSARPSITASRGSDMCILAHKMATTKTKKLKAVIDHCSCTLLYGCAHGAVCMRSYTIMPMAAAWHTEVQFVRKIFSRKLVVNLMLSVQPLPLLLLLLFIDIDEWCTV